MPKTSKKTTKCVQKTQVKKMVTTMVPPEAADPRPPALSVAAAAPALRPVPPLKPRLPPIYDPLASNPAATPPESCRINPRHVKLCEKFQKKSEKFIALAKKNERYHSFERAYDYYSQAVEALTTGIEYGMIYQDSEAKKKMGEKLTELRKQFEEASQTNQEEETQEATKQQKKLTEPEIRKMCEQFLLAELALYKKGDMGSIFRGLIRPFPRDGTTSPVPSSWTGSESESETNTPTNPPPTPTPNVSPSNSPPDSPTTPTRSCSCGDHFCLRSDSSDH